ncbi:TetR/AcrR family transcriptional regulator [Aureimonas ureilytica]|uniref:TetR/AcrR family transcriptional regulator n=1 Tax=Aureimonas ureilytica TaxID=401562 RepID=UPI000AC35DB4|nr:TetR/AcrR family transcriptional regulator [Aureimonas ureilytica]
MSRGRPREFDFDRALNAAMLEFWKNGYSATSLSDLSRCMRISSPSIYAAYGSKEELFTSTIKYYQDNYATELKSSLSVNDSFFCKIENFLESAIDLYTRSDLPKGCFLLLAHASNSPDDGILQTYLSRARWSWVATVKDIIDEAIKIGELRAETPSDAIAMMTVATLQGLAVAARDGVCKDRLQEASTILTSLLRNWAPLS